MVEKEDGEEHTKLQRSACEHGVDLLRNQRHPASHYTRQAAVVQSPQIPA